MYRIAKNTNKASNDVKQMKDSNGVVLMDKEVIQERWKEYFRGLLNEENPRDHQNNGTPYPGSTGPVAIAEVVSALISRR